MREPVSVVVPTFNRAGIVGRALESILAQVCPQDEVIVVDDGSGDHTKRVVTGFGEKVRYIYQQNQGAGAARNHGISLARHDLVAFLDSDDEWLPGKLDTQCALMTARPDLVMSSADWKLRLADGRELDGGSFRWHRDPRPWEARLGPSRMLSDIIGSTPGGTDLPVHIGYAYPYLMSACFVSAFTAMVRKSRVGEEFYFTPQLRIYEDWACFGRVAAQGEVAFIDGPLAVQNGHTEGRLTDADSYTRATARIVILKEVWGADQGFLQKHGEHYRTILDEQRLIKAAGLISEGRTAEARAELSQVRRPPIAHRALSFMPGPLARAALAARRAMLGTKSS